MDQPRVTCVIPLHNHAHWIKGAIESVANQDYPNKRIVVVDDGSADGSYQEAVRGLYAAKVGQVVGMKGEPECRFGRVPNNGTGVVVIRFPEARGPSFARNRGVEATWKDTDVYAFLDSDDLYEQGKLSKSVARIVAAPNTVGAVYSDFDTVRPDGLRLRQFKEPFSRERLQRECIVNCDSLVTKKALEECGVFDESMRTCEDYDLWYRVSERFLIVHVPESLVTIRVGQHSSSSTIPKEVWERNWRRVMEKAQARNAH